MALYEYFCDPCRKKFEAIRPYADSAQAQCPRCGEQSGRKLISRFAVGGQGDLRESTMHGCHGCHGHGHSHGHGDASVDTSGGDEHDHGHSPAPAASDGGSPE